ncbi:hypothetical protein [Pedobacter sp. Hv1]|uniref:hypothetical protein n=1 Tax=Pedobacter sp. Hv1 TaxID=1740090 RepID=UPI0006D88DE8|nr:hypothetical protein [Pedobacter sp. Hv1]KQC01712.1 hypothetical protein AQF98_04885 [Pedobacter sp. Hv1]
MLNTIPELLRKKSVQAIFQTPTMQNVWPTWLNEIHHHLGANFAENDIINLGDNLGNIFRSTAIAGRDQGALSSGGTAWESLVCWYINLCCVGSRIVAIKTMSMVPKPIQDATTINYANFACNTESDITVIIFPNANDYNQDVNNLNIIDDHGNTIPTTVTGRINPHALNFLTERDFLNLEIGVIQCKTNWNDNAQIPMLWDMIYSAGGFSGRNITIGRNNFNIQHVRNFTYSFVTVPSNARANYNQNSVAVKRVTNLSGGNFWGQHTNVGVARSVKEIFNNNYSSGSRTNLRNDLRQALPDFKKNGDLEYFKLL